METLDLFLLNSTWRDEAQNHALVFWGTSGERGPVELVFTQHPPVFFIDRDEKLPALDFPFERKQLGLKSFSGRPVDGIYFQTQRDHRQGWDRFRATGVRHFEADVRPDERFLMERFIQGGVKVMGESEACDGWLRFTDPKIKASVVYPKFSMCSLDIETGVQSGELYSIGVHLTKGGIEEKKVFMLAGERKDLPEDLSLFPSEAELMQAFFAWFAKADPDLIIGWHVIGFDLMFLERKCSELGIPFGLARGGGEVILVEKPGAGYFATVPGRLVVDGPPMLRAAGYSFPNFKLETVAQDILETGKLIASDSNKIAEIERQFKNDKPALARYNLEDCVLVTQIFEKVGMVDFLISRVHTSGLLIDELGLPHAAFDRYYLPRLHRLGLVAATAEESGKKATKSLSLLPPKPGIYDHVALLDFSSLHPSMVCSFNIDPLALLKSDINPAITPSGCAFSKTEKILPDYLLKLMAGLQESTKRMHQSRARAHELILENLCMVLQSKNSRFYREEMDKALAVCVDWFLKETKNFAESVGHQVIYGDADSILVKLNTSRETELERTARQLAEDLGTHCRRKMKSEFGVDATLAFEFRRVFRKLMLPEAKNQTEAGRKRFGGLALQEGKPKLVFEGMSLTGSDWVPLAKDFQRTLLHKFFHNEPVEAFVREFVAALREGAYDDQLTYRKKLKKDLDSYAKNPPPQVRAARHLEKPGKYIDYVFTKRGPMPKKLVQNDVDYEHYVTKQLEPVGDTLFQLLGQSFSQMAEHKQFELF